MPFSYTSFPNTKSRHQRQTQQSSMNGRAISSRNMQDERSRGRQRNRRGDSPVPPQFPNHDYGPSGYGFDGFEGSPRQPSPQRPRGGRDGMGLDGLGYTTYSPQPSRLRRRARSPEGFAAPARDMRNRAGDYASTESSESVWERISRFTQHSPQRGSSPAPRRYAPRSTTSGNLSFGTARPGSTCRSSLASLSLGPPALDSRSSSRYRTTASQSFPSSKSIDHSTVRDTSASRNLLTRVQRSQYQPERESPREALRRAQVNSRVPEYARGPERAIPVDSVRQRGIERYHNADGFPNWYEQQLRHAQPIEVQRSHGGGASGRRVNQQGFRKWYWGSGRF